MRRRPVLFMQKQAPGDTVVLTALARDLALAYPNRYDVLVQTHAAEIWQNNPRVRVYTGGLPEGAIRFRPEEDKGILNGIRASQRERVSYLNWPHRLFAERTGIEVPPGPPHPDIHLSADERANPFPGLPPRYWAIAAGGKSDATVKIWPAPYWQDLVDRLAARGIPCVHVGRTKCYVPPKHIQPKLAGVYDTLDRAPLRELIRIIHHADGVVCGISLPMHLAAALGRPCVVLAGGREAWNWEAYCRENVALANASELAVPHRFLHSGVHCGCNDGRAAEGVLADGGCWKQWVRPEEQEKPGRLCLLPERAGNVVTPRCQAMIVPRLVEEAVMSHYADGTILPVELDPEWRRTFEELTAPRRAAARAAAPPPPLPAAPAAPPARAAAMVPVYDPEGYDLPAVGGRITLFTLLYGDYPALHARFLDALAPSLVPGRVELRVLSSQLGAAATRRVEAMAAAGLVAHWDRRGDNQGKYVRMRRAFRDPDHPIETRYLAWLDDDSIVRDPDWLRKLAVTIGTDHDAGCRLFGPVYWYTLRRSQLEWVRQSPWYRGRPLRDEHGKPSEGGRRVRFAIGSLWALEVAAMRELDIPDPRLGHNGGDWTIGACVAQGGYEIGSFGADRAAVDFDSVGRTGRRGTSEPHPGMPGWRPAEAQP